MQKIKGDNKIIIATMDKQIKSDLKFTITQYPHQNTEQDKWRKQNNKRYSNKQN